MKKLEGCILDVFLLIPIMHKWPLSCSPESPRFIRSSLPVFLLVSYRDLRWSSWLAPTWFYSQSEPAENHYLITAEQSSFLGLRACARSFFKCFCFVFVFVFFFLLLFKFNLFVHFLMPKLGNWTTGKPTWLEIDNVVCRVVTVPVWTGGAGNDCLNLNFRQNFP